jgi:diguanylate cyclase (GGDEF)-like protein
MAASGKEEADFKEELLRRGVPKEEIKKVYKTLRGKGYGEEEARRQSRAAFQKQKTQKELEERRQGAPPPPEPASARPAAAGRADAQQAAQAAALDDLNRRAVDWLPIVPPWLRRRINRYAYSRGFLITRLPERFDDFMSFFDATRADYASRALLRLMAAEKGYHDQNPFQLSFIDTLNALRDSARILLRGPSGTKALEREKAEERAEEMLRALRAREPFVVVFFAVFTERRDMLRKSLEFLGSNLRAGLRVRVAELARVVKDGCRLIAVTESLERDKLEMLFEVVRDVNISSPQGARGASELAEAESLFRAAFQNLHRFGHELYPALLKMIAAFYPEEDTSPAKRTAVLQFLGLKEEEILTWEAWQRRMREAREKALKERQEKELARLEQEKAEQFGVRFEGTLSTLESLFPESGIERMEQGAFILPYFANRVFTRSAVFQSRLADLEKLSSTDAVALLMVLHSILDDLLESMEPYALEKIIGTEGVAAAFIALRDSWHEAYLRFFEPYLEEIREYARETEGDPRFAKLFRESQRARSIEERINQLRNRAIRNFGHVITEREHYDGPKPFELSAQLCLHLFEAGKVINQATLSAEDPVRRKTVEDISAFPIVDFALKSQTGSTEYRPIARQIKRWIEARFRESVSDIPHKAQVAFMDVFRGVAEIYEYLLNDPRSFVAQAGHGVTIASAEDHDVWARERDARGRDSFQLLQETLREEFPGQFVDALTGLKNKDYFLIDLPRRLDKLRAKHKSLTLLLIDIDHFKWVNDELGHPRGDEVLKATADMVLDGVREGDLPIRYGGEEILVVVPSNLHTGIILAERLRHAQESNIRNREAMGDVRSIGDSQAQPCGTLSIGVADVTGILDLAKAVERADKALYAAKRTRNAVVFVDPGKENAGGEPYSTYAEYRRKAYDTKA